MLETKGIARRAGVGDAQGIAGLIAECYGATHPVPAYLNPAALAAEIERGDAVYAVVEEEGRLVAQAALVRAGTSGLYECTRAVVSVARRDRGYFGDLAKMLIDETASEIGARFVMARAVTNHLFAQRFARSSGGVASGVLLGMIPGSLSVAGFGVAGSPVSTIVHIHRIERAPRERVVSLGDRDFERVSEVLERLSVPVRRRARPEGGSALGVTIQQDPNFGVAHMRFSAVAPVRDVRHDIVRELAREARLVWADVPIEEPAAIHLIDELRAAGLGYAGYVPLAGLAGEDVLRLQLVVDPAVRDGLVIRALEENQGLVDSVLDEARGTPVLVR